MNVISLVPLVLAIAVSSTPASIFILAGQSNMAGQGGTFTADGKWDGLTPPECQSNPHIFRLDDEPVSCSNNNGSSGIGPGMPFSNSLLKRDPSIGLVLCAVGGTGIREWSRGSCLYNRLLNRTRASVSLARRLPSGQALVALASGGTNGADKAIVTEAQLKTSLPIAKCVDAEGLPLNGDDLHLTTMSQVRLGATLADAYLKYFN